MKMLYYNPDTDKRYSQSVLEKMYGPVDGLSMASFGLYVIETDVAEEDKVFYLLSDGGVDGSVDKGFRIKWTKNPRKVEDIRSSLKNLAAAKRFEIETGGITFAGKKIITDRDSQYMISGAVNAVSLDPTRIVKFKTHDGFIELDKDAIIALAKAVADHVQACFSREADLNTAINEAATIGELKDIYDNEIKDGWPV